MQEWTTARSVGMSRPIPKAPGVAQSTGRRPHANRRWMRVRSRAGLPEATGAGMDLGETMSATSMLRSVHST